MTRIDRQADRETGTRIGKHIGSWSRSFQGQDHFEVKIMPESNCKCLDFYSKADGWLSTECILVGKWLKKGGERCTLNNSTSGVF